LVPDEDSKLLEVAGFPVAKVTSIIIRVAMPSKVLSLRAQRYQNTTIVNPLGLMIHTTTSSGSPEFPMTVYLLITTGAIEKIYSEQTGEVANLSNKIDRYLAKLRLPDAEMNVVPLMNKDSLEMTDHDRVLLLSMVRAILKENAPIVITHGADTMVESGRYLANAGRCERIAPSIHFH